MALINIFEIIGLIAIVFYLGYLFTGLFTPRIKTAYDLIHPKRFNWKDFKFAVILTAPAIVLHELAHKFVAMAFGYPATFYAFYSNATTLMLAIFSIILKFFNSPFIFIIPGFVSISPNLTDPIIYRLVAFAGPAANLALWGIAYYIIKNKKLNRKQLAIWGLTKKLNMFLFIFNMIPLGPLDGAKVFFGP